MKKLSFITLLAAFIVICSSVIVFSDFYVISVPKGCEGNAEAEHVLTGYTFSNSTERGISGTRAPAPVAKSGETLSYATGDDGDLEKVLHGQTQDLQTTVMERLQTI